jgi:hypothetical protein
MGLVVIQACHMPHWIIHPQVKDRVGEADIGGLPRIRREQVRTRLVENSFVGDHRSPAENTNSIMTGFNFLRLTPRARGEHLEIAFRLLLFVMDGSPGNAAVFLFRASVGSAPLQRPNAALQPRNDGAVCMRTDQAPACSARFVQPLLPKFHLKSIFR